MADYSAGLRVVDVSDPAAPLEVGFLDTPSRAESVSAAGGYAYVADWASGLRVVDLSNPVCTTRGRSPRDAGRAWGVAVAGDLAYVVGWQSGLEVVDVSPPSAPVEVGVYDAPHPGADDLG